MSLFPLTHVYIVGLFCISLLHLSFVSLFCISLLYVSFSCLCYMSLFPLTHVYNVVLFCISLLHLSFRCQTTIALTYVCVSSYVCAYAYVCMRTFTSIDICRHVTCDAKTHAHTDTQTHTDTHCQIWRYQHAQSHTSLPTSSSVLQCVAVCCSVLQCVAVCWHNHTHHSLHLPSFLLRCDGIFLSYPNADMSLFSCLLVSFDVYVEVSFGVLRVVVSECRAHGVKGTTHLFHRYARSLFPGLFL